MTKECVVCGKKFEANGGNAKYCSQTCKYLGPYSEDDDESYKKIDALRKFVYYMFNKSPERTKKLKNGEYSLWNIYTSYLYFLSDKYECKAHSLRIWDEYLFTDLFIDAVKEKKRISLVILSSLSSKEIRKITDRNFYYRYLNNSPSFNEKPQNLPQGEEWFYVDSSSNRYQSFELAREQYIDEEDLPTDIKEQQFEKLFVETVNRANGICWKLAASSPGCSGVPDRVAVFPCGKFGFVEMKRPNSNEQPRPNQIKQLNKALQLTSHVYVLSDPELVRKVIQDIQFDTYPETRYIKQ